MVFNKTPTVSSF